MSDSYQAIYDAVRSRISGGDISGAVRDVLWQQFDISHMRAILQQEFCIAAYEMQRPSAVFKPKLYPDGDQWCALYGENLQEGCAGFGDTPALAMQQFDIEWLNAKLTSRNATTTPPDSTSVTTAQSPQMQRAITRALKALRSNSHVQ